MTITSIIFDWGGVLTIGKHSHSIEKLLKTQYNVGVSYAELCKSLDKMDCGALSIAEFTKIINEKFNCEISAKEMARLFCDAIKPNKGIIHLARKLSGKYEMIMLSNNNISTVAALRKNQSKMLAIFDKVYFSCDLKTRKPHKKIYKIMLKRSHLTPENCIFIDDVKPNVETAKKLGINTIQFKSEDKLKRDLKKLGVVVN